MRNSTGGVSLIVILAVLCLTVFAILTLSTVLADSRLSSGSIASAESYYKADSIAEEKIAELRERSAEGEQSFSVPISDTQTLFVEADISGGEVYIKRWETVYTAPWEPDSSLSVWGGD